MTHDEFQKKVMTLARRECSPVEAGMIALELIQEHKRLCAWVDDLQSGMYVNCVYCGHQYGPGETTPVSMAEALKTHVETCPEHPMSRLKSENRQLRDERSVLIDAVAFHGALTPAEVEGSLPALIAGKAAQSRDGETVPHEEAGR